MVGIGEVIAIRCEVIRKLEIICGSNPTQIAPESLGIPLETGLTDESLKVRMRRRNHEHEPNFLDLQCRPISSSWA